MTSLSQTYMSYMVDKTQQPNKERINYSQNH